MRVLVAYGSKHGSTAEVAQWIAGELRLAGLDAQVRAAAEVDDVAGYDAVVLGSAVHLGRWRLEPRRFALRHGAALAGVPVWLFSSGPLSDDDDGTTPSQDALVSARLLSAREHVVFGGCLEPDVPGFLDSAIARCAYGDYRNRQQISAWADRIADTLKQEARRPAAPAHGWHGERQWRWDTAQPPRSLSAPAPPAQRGGEASGAEPGPPPPGRRRGGRTPR